MRDILDRCQVTKKLFSEVVGATYVMVWHWEKGTRSMDGKKGLKAKKLLDLMSKAEKLGLFANVSGRTTRAQLVAAIKQAAAHE